MNTKIAYVLTSDNNDSYLEQLLLSLHSLRKHMPDAYVVLLTDDETIMSFDQEWRKIVYEYVNECKAVKIPNGMNKKLRSRYIKTSLRESIDGDFVYIDCDTLILGALDDLDTLSCKIGAVKDAHCDVACHPMRFYFTEDNHKVGFDIENETSYFNGGFFFVKDCSETRTFFATWKKEWMEGVKKGVSVDMPSFAKTNSICNHLIDEIPAIYNCQLVYGSAYFSKAKVLHYFSSNFGNFAKDYPFYLQSKDAFERIKKAKMIDEKIQNIVNNPFQAFNSVTELISGREVDFIHTPIVAIIRRIYYKHSKLFHKICDMYYFLYRRKKVK